MLTERSYLANLSFYRSFNTRAAETVGHSFFELDDGQWDVPLLVKHWNACAAKIGISRTS